MASALASPEEQAMDAIRLRTFWRGDAPIAAKTLGISCSHLVNLKNGSVPMTSRTAARILAKAREEELALADKLERELNAHWLKDGEL